MPVMEVLLVLEDSHSGQTQRSIVRVAAHRGDTVKDLKARVEELNGFPRAFDITVLYNGQQLEDRDAVDTCGAAASTGTEQWSEDYIYPNGWFILGHRKAYPKVGSGCTWTALRSAALDQGATGGALKLLLLICLANTLLALLPGAA